jgi:uncharacterized protein (TIGR02300 family)
MPELGTKHECAGCGAKFYDLGNEPVCPKCGLNQLAEEEPPVEAAADEPEEAPAEESSEDEDHGEEE